MFEDATFHSSNVLPSQARKWMLLTFGVNLSLVAAMIVLPLIYPDGLPAQPFSHILYAPSAPAHIRQTQTRTAIAATQPSQSIVSQLQVPRIVPSRPLAASDDASGSSEPFGSVDLGGNGDTTGALPTAAFHTTNPLVGVRPPQPSSVKLSSGVTEGLLVSQTLPPYPVIAKTTGTSGMVILAAVISTSGRIQNLRVVSGSPMLRQAAIDAVKTWRYRPYRLNNQPVEVETTINVVFSLGNH